MYKVISWFSILVNLIILKAAEIEDSYPNSLFEEQCIKVGKSVTFENDAVQSNRGLLSDSLKLNGLSLEIFKQEISNMYLVHVEREQGSVLGENEKLRILKDFADFIQNVNWTLLETLLVSGPGTDMPITSLIAYYVDLLNEFTSEEFEPIESMNGYRTLGNGLTGDEKLEYMNRSREWAWINVHSFLNSNIEEIDQLWKVTKSSIVFSHRRLDQEDFRLVYN